MIRSPHKPFAQLVKRIEERNKWESKRRVPLTNDIPTIQTIVAGTKNDSFYMAENGTVVKVLGKTAGTFYSCCVNISLKLLAKKCDVASLFQILMLLSHKYIRFDNWFALFKPKSTVHRSRLFNCYVSNLQNHWAF